MVGSRIPTKYLALILAPLAIFVAMTLIISLFANTALDLQAIDGHSASATAEASGRIQALGATFLFVVVCLGLAAKTTQEVWHLFAARRQTELIVLLAFGAILTVGMTFSSDIYRVTIGSTLYRDALASKPVVSGTGLWGPFAFESIRYASGILLGVAVCSLVLACLSCVAEPDGNPRLDEQLAYWTLQFERLTGFAYLGTAVLALGVLVQRTQLAYPAFIVPDDGRDRFAALLNARCAYDGIEYSLIIAAIILPTLIVVQSKLEGPNDGAPTSENAKPGLNEGVASRGRASLWDVAKLIVAMLLPLLTGALSGLAGIVA